MHAIGGLLFTAFLIVAMGVEQLATAGNVVHKLGDGESVQFRCDGGALTTEKHTGSVAYWKCTKDVGPEPGPEPEPQPPGKCGQPVSDSKPLLAGQEARIKLSLTPVNRYFCSTQYPAGTNLSWGPWSASSFSALTVIVSTTPNNTDVNSVERPCFRGGPTDSMNVGPSGCRLADNTLYYVSITAKHPVTGRLTAGGAGELVLFNAKK